MTRGIFFMTVTAEVHPTAIVCAIALMTETEVTQEAATILEIVLAPNTVVVVQDTVMVTRNDFRAEAAVVLATEAAMILLTCLTTAVAVTEETETILLIVLVNEVVVVEAADRLLFAVLKTEVVVVEATATV